MMKRSKINILLCDTFPGLLPPENEAIKSIQRWNHQGRMVAQYILNFFNLT